MKSILGLVLMVNLGSAIHHKSWGAPEEFEARRQELKDSADKTTRLTDQWLRRVDSYDPDIDQEMVSEILNAGKRTEAIRRLTEKKGKMNPWYADFEETN